MKTDLVRACGARFHVHPRDLMGSARFAFLMPARFAAYKVLYARGNSYLAIARLFDRDHSTIIHGVRQAERMMQEDENYARIVQDLIEMQANKVTIHEDSPISDE